MKAAATLARRKDPVHPNVSSFGESATLAIHERSAALSREGRRVYRIGFGQSPFPVPERVVEALRRHAPRKEYLPVRGLAELRQAVAAHPGSSILPGAAPDR